MTTFEIKTHNPWSIALSMLCSIFLPIILLSKIYEEGIVIVTILLCFFAGQAICYYLITETIEVVISDSGICAKWMSPPFFTQTDTEIRWEDIMYWNFISSKMMDSLIITTKNGKKYSIRCLRGWSIQLQLIDFEKNLTEEIKTFNEKLSNHSDEIRQAPSFFEKRIGKLFAIIVAIFLIGYSYFLFTGSLDFDSFTKAKIVLLYLYGLSIIGFVVAYAIIKNRKKNRKR